MSLPSVASRIPVRYYANSRAITTFRKYWENVGWSFKGRLGCSARVPRKCSQGSPFPANILVYVSRYTLLKCARVCTNDLGSKRHAIEIENRSKAALAICGSSIENRKENSTSLLQIEMQSASGRFARLLESRKYLFK